MDNFEVVNNVLVNLFNKILFNEEIILKKRVGADLSIKDIHILQAINDNKDYPTSSNVAKTLNITLGTLTIAINKLVQKGYVIRQRDSEDKRKVQLALTSKGTKVNNIHQDFHRKMVDEILNELNLKEQDILVLVIKKISEIFDIKD